VSETYTAWATLFCLKVNVQFVNSRLPQLLDWIFHYNVGLKHETETWDWNMGLEYGTGIWDWNMGRESGAAYSWTDCLWNPSSHFEEGEMMPILVV